MEKMYMEENNIEEYIMEALFALMKVKPFASITVTDIAKKAGVSRITYYRHFKNKEEILIKYFAKQSQKFQEETFLQTRTKDDYYEIIFKVFSRFKQQKEFLKLLVSAHIQYIFLNVLNSGMKKDYYVQKYGKDEYASSYYAGALYNMSLEWLKNDCKESVKSMADTFFKLTFQKEILE